MGTDNRPPDQEAKSSHARRNLVAMCKHILNAQASIRAPCCRKWFDCPECHAETADHTLKREVEMIFMCKKCKKAFRKDMTVYDEADEYCPHCDNHYVIEAKTPQAMLVAEGEDARVDNRMLRDDRIEEQRMKGLEDSLRELEDLMADGVKLDQRAPPPQQQQ